MIKFEHAEVIGWEAAIRGMRNSHESWDKSDSGFCETQGEDCTGCAALDENGHCTACMCVGDDEIYFVGKNNLDLMTRLRNAGTDHRKFMRMITVYVDITAPLYWWKEFDTYKIGTVANSCSTMHSIHKKEFTLDDFSCEHLNIEPLEILKSIIKELNVYRDAYNDGVETVDEKTGEHISIDPHDKNVWWQMIQLLPSSYNQKRTVMMNYEVLANIYKSRRNHKLDEWKEHKKNIPDSTSQALYSRDDESYFGFCDWIKTLPYSEIITSKE